MADVWEQLQEGIDEAIAEQRKELDILQAQVSNRIEKAKGDVVLSEIKALGRRLDVIEQKLTEKEEDQA